MTIVDLAEKVQAILDKYAMDYREKEQADLPAMLNYVIESAFFQGKALSSARLVVSVFKERSDSEASEIVDYEIPLFIQRIASDVAGLFHRQTLGDKQVILWVIENKALVGWESSIQFDVLSLQSF